MSSDLFDLGMVLRSYASGQPQLRFATDMHAHDDHFVCASIDRHGVILTHYGNATHRGRSSVLSAMAKWVIEQLDDETPVPSILVVPNRRELRKLWQIARNQGGASALLLDYWASHAELPGRGGVLVVTETARRLYAIAEPAKALSDFQTWQRWLALSNPIMAALKDAYRLMGGSVQPSESAQKRWQRMHSRFQELGEWRPPRLMPDHVKVMEFHDREKAADRAEFQRLSDPTQRRRAVWEGKIMDGTVVGLGKGEVTVASDQPMSRLRTDSKISIIKGHVRSEAVVRRVGMGVAGGYSITVSTALSCCEGDQVTLMPQAPPNLESSLGKLAQNVKGRPPAVVKRTVPIDVILGAVTPSA